MEISESLKMVVIILLQPVFNPILVPSPEAQGKDACKRSAAGRKGSCPKYIKNFANRWLLYSDLQGWYTQSQ
jgi:hypothetical protein